MLDDLRRALKSSNRLLQRSNEVGELTAIAVAIIHAHLSISSVAHVEKALPAPVKVLSQDVPGSDHDLGTLAEGQMGSVARCRILTG